MRTVDAAGLAIGPGAPPRIMGVLNVSPQSPYSPSVYDDPVDAAAYADTLIEEGADIIDVGLESANKRFEVRSPAWELDQLDLAVETLKHVSGEAVFSIETRYAEVAEAALTRGFDMVNDICGFADPAMPEVCAAHDAAVVKMAGPGDLERPGALEDVDAIYAALAEGLTAKTIIDPAFGVWSAAKTIEDDTAIFRRLGEFRAIGHPVLVSINRKNFIRKPLGRSTEDALPGSLAATALAVERGADVVRTHDVADTRDAALIGDRFAREWAQVGRVVEVGVSTVGEAARYIEQFGGDAGDARRCVTKAFVVEDLDARERDALERATANSPVVCVIDGDRAFLAGTPAALTRIVDEGGDLGGVGAALEAAV